MIVMRMAITPSLNASRRVLFTVLASLQRNNGAPGGSRTHDLRLRRPSLYPAELRARFECPILGVRRPRRYNSSMAKTDHHFRNVFSAVLGVLIAIALVLVGISRMVDSGPKGARDTDDPLMQASAHERIKPFGQVAVAGEDNAALAIKTTAVAVGRRAGSGRGDPDRRKVRLRHRLLRLPWHRHCGCAEDRRQGRLGAAHRAGHGDARDARHQRLYRVRRA